MARNLVPEGERLAQPEIPGAPFRKIVQIGAANSPGSKAYNYLTRSRKRFREVLDCEIARRAKDAGFHGGLALSMGRSQ
jgi:hypothetical protein